MKALLLVAHGSRRAASNEEVVALADRVADEVTGSFALVEAAFLELAEPSIEEGIGRCVAQGAREIAVVPYFLAAGTHVVKDIPAIIESARAAHPGVVITVGEHVGASSQMPALIRQCAVAP